MDMDGGLSLANATSQAQTSPFLRRESKYLMDESTMAELLRLLDGKIVFDVYCPGGKEYHVSTVYFDNEHRDVARTSVDKPEYKAKLRLRDYGNGCRYLELKKKFQGVVFKKRIIIDEGEYHSILDSLELPKRDDYASLSVLNDTKRFLETFPGQEGMTDVAYERLAFSSAPGQGDYRLTFDRDLKARPIEGSNWETIVPRGKVLMEIKCAGALPLYFVRILNELRVYPTSFSKYGRYYINETRKR